MNSNLSTGNQSFIPVTSENCVLPVDFGIRWFIGMTLLFSLKKSQGAKDIAWSAFMCVTQGR